MSSNKTFSAKLGFGSFYTELGVQVLDVCMRTRSSNGGLIGLQDLTRRVISLRGSNSGGIESGDILRAVRSLQVKNYPLIICNLLEYCILLTIPDCFQLLDPGFSLVSVSGAHCLMHVSLHQIAFSLFSRLLYDFVSSQGTGQRPSGRRVFVLLQYTKCRPCMVA